MISILIPTYNYNITALVCQIHKQCTNINTPFEIIGIEDGSTKHVNSNKNGINTLQNTTIIHNKTNIGRTNARHLLSKKAQYNWLLFLDADVQLKSTNFIQTYISNIQTNQYDAYYGGFTYTKKKPKDQYVLRWKYGQLAEDVNAQTRNQTPYKVVISGNFLIKKELFNTLSSKIKIKSYGLDNYFGILLKQHQARVLHLNNPVIHLGLDPNKKYLNKVKEAVDVLLTLLKTNKIDGHQNKLLDVFLCLKKYKINYLVYAFFLVGNPLLKFNLLGKYPNIKILQIYKIAYMCYKDLN